MIEEEYIWYAGYGSNIDEKRFLCYILGGRPDGNSKNYKGARNTNLPLFNEGMILNHELYFAKYSESWKGAVSFIKSETNEVVKTYARRYMIAKGQFEDVAKQETGMSDPPAINFDEARIRGYTIFKTPSWYGKVLFVGMNVGIPIFTLTKENNSIICEKPSESYLRVIGNGIRTVFKTDNNKLCDYFMTKQGVTGNYTRKQLLEILIT